MSAAELPIRIVTVSGSLRRESSNARLLDAAALLAPEHVELRPYGGLGELPPFNPDIEADPPQAVRALQEELWAADALLISSPEYAHGVPGALKNMLDWVVGSGELVDKPVALLSASPRSVYAQASLLETLKVMSARVVEAACTSVELAGVRLDAEGIAADPELGPVISAALRELVEAAREYRVGVPAT